MEEISKNKLPTTKELEQELYRTKYNSRYSNLIKNSIYVLIIIIAIAILVATLIFPVLQVYESSMNPNIKKDDIVLAVKKSKFVQGDVIAFYYNNHILIKRVIATPGDWVEFDIEGNVYVNGELVIEPYVNTKEVGTHDIEFPYQVEENSYFVLNDDRTSTLDSRNSAIGTIEEENIIGEIVFKLWPIKRIGIIKNK